MTTIPGRGEVALDQFHYRVAEEDLPKFASLVQTSTLTLPDPRTLCIPEELDDFTTRLARVFENAIEIAGKPNRAYGRTAP